MRSMREMSRALSRVLTCVVLLMVLMPALALAQAPQAPATETRAGGEVNLVLPDLSSVDVGGFSSRHPGVINVALADGSVHAISDQIDAELFRQLGNRADGQIMKPF